MLQYNIPQFVDTEDKVIGPLTLRQFAYLVIGTVILGFLWVFKPNMIAFVIMAVPVAGISCAFAFVRVYHQDFGTFVNHIILFVTNPTIYIWKRSGRDVTFVISSKIKKSDKLDYRKDKNFSQSRVSEIAWTLDTYGQKDMNPNMDNPPD